MDNAMNDLRQQDPNQERAREFLDEASLADSLELAYTARMKAVLHGPATAQARTARDVAQIERLCLERQEIHQPSPVTDADPLHYLG